MENKDIKNEERYEHLINLIRNQPEVPEICRDCDVFNYGMSSEYCGFCTGPKQFFYGDDE